jgi:hypothetical protein
MKNIEFIFFNKVDVVGPTHNFEDIRYFVMEHKISVNALETGLLVCINKYEIPVKQLIKRNILNTISWPPLDDIEFELLSKQVIHVWQKNRT